MAGEMIRIEGLEGVKAELARIEGAANADAMRAGLRAGGLVFLGGVQQGADRARRSLGGMIPWVGVLAADVRMWSQRVGDALAVVVGFGRFSWQVAGWVEYGHRMIRRATGGAVRLHVKGGGSGTVTDQVPAYPFIRPAFEIHLREAVLAFGAAFMERLKKK